jgi:hypothetical protein
VVRLLGCESVRSVMPVSPVDEQHLGGSFWMDCRCFGCHCDVEARHCHHSRSWSRRPNKFRRVSKDEAAGKGLQLQIWNTETRLGRGGRTKMLFCVSFGVPGDTGRLTGGMARRETAESVFEIRFACILANTSADKYESWIEISNPIPSNHVFTETGWTRVGLATSEHIWAWFAEKVFHALSEEESKSHT